MINLGLCQGCGWELLFVTKYACGLGITKRLRTSCGIEWLYVTQNDFLARIVERLRMVVGNGCM